MTGAIAAKARGSKCRFLISVIRQMERIRPFRSVWERSFEGKAMSTSALASTFAAKREEAANGRVPTEVRNFVPTLQKIGQAACIAVMSLVAVVLIGWMLRLPILVSIVPGLMAMNAFTAAGIGMAAGSL